MSDLKAKLADGFEHFDAVAFGMFDVLNTSTASPENFAQHRLYAIPPREAVEGN